MADRASKVAADIASAANPPVRDWKAEQAKVQADRLKAENDVYRRQAAAVLDVQQERAIAEFWNKPGSWSDEQYRAVCAELPPRPGSK